MHKLGGFIKSGKEEQASQLLSSLSAMLHKAPDLTLQDRLLSICQVAEQNVIFSVAQARILFALSHTIAPKVYHKRKYYVVMTSLYSQLE